MKIETKYCCSFCDESFWDKDDCEEHEKQDHECLHCRNLIIYFKDQSTGEISCDCEAHWFHRSYGSCTYHVEGAPNTKYCIEI
jgi:hypothetical protein